MRLLSRTLSRSLVTLLVAVLGLTVVPAVVTPSSAVAATEWELQGRGWGHGIGLSQWGAQMAAKQRLGYRRILGFYYPGTQVGHTTGSIRVLITAETRTSLVVANRSGLSVRSVSSGASYPLVRSRATHWRISPTSDNLTSRVWVRVGGVWRLVRQIRGQAEFVAPSLRMYLPSGSSKVYRGRLRSVIVNGQRDVVNVLPLDHYVRGVVPLEMPASWEREAVRSQTIAARTYAAFERADRTDEYFDVYDTTRSQVYGGLGAEEPQTNAAVTHTAGEIRLYQGKPAFTQFSSSNGGWTVASAGGQPYLKAQADPYDPIRTWRWTLTQAELRKAAPGIGTATAVQVVARDGHGAGGGRATSVKITGTLKTVTIDATALRSSIGLLSTYFWIV